MKKNKLYAVITGDIIGSSRLNSKQRNELLSVLKSSFKTMKSVIAGGISASFEIYRGDSFQGVLSDPKDALRAVIAIRANIRLGFETKRRRHALDARIAVGIGSIDLLPDGRGTEGDGEAFRRSGPVLDNMKGDRKLLIRTPSSEIDAELDIECALLDVLISRWSSEQAEAILGKIQGLTQEEAAEKFGDISQPAIRQRLKFAGGWAIEILCNRYEQLISGLKSSGAYNNIK